MAQMKDDELDLVFSSIVNDTTSHNSTFMEDNEEYLRRYNGEPYGDEEAGFSSVIATDVRDTVEADMTSMVRVFLGSGHIITFESLSDDPKAEAEALHKTEYLNWLVQRRLGAYKTIYGFLKDAEIQKMGVLHYYIETVRETNERFTPNQTLIQINALEAKEREEDSVIEVDILEKEAKGENERGDALFDIRTRVTREIKVTRIDNIPTEDFLLSLGAASLDEAQGVGHATYPTRSELVESGMTEEEVDKFPTASENATGSPGNQQQSSASGDDSGNMKTIRWRDEGGNITDSDSFNEWSAQTVKRVQMYAKIDFDGDGVAERRRIVKIGETITENDAYDHVPYAMTSAIPEPHKAIGDGRASLVIQDQSVNTELDRALNDNIYDVGNPRDILGDGVNIDDYLEEERRGVVRMNPGSSSTAKDGVAQLLTPYVGDAILQVKQAREIAKQNRTGGILASQGLEADQLNEETAARFNGMEKASEAKIELVARNHGEIGFMKLYKGLEWMLQRFQDEPQDIRIKGKMVTIRPSEWQHKAEAISQIGLGAGSGEQGVQQLSAIFAVQTQLHQEGSLLVDEQDRYNTLDKMIQEFGFAKTSDFFNNPDVPRETLMAQYQNLVKAMKEAQQQIEILSQQNPLAEAEAIKARGTLEVNREKNQLKAAEIENDNQNKMLDRVNDTAEFESKQALEYTKLELDHNVDIPGEGQ